MQPPHVRDDQLDDASFPQFEPHITLASIPLDTPIVRVRENIPPDKKQFKVSFTSVEVGTHYFRSVYIAVRLSPELAKLHQEIHAALGIVPKTPAYPHISLCYVTNEDAGKGNRQQFFEGLRIRNDEEGIALNCGAGEKEDWMGEFLAGDIWIVRCKGPVETWEVLDVIELESFVFAAGSVLFRRHQETQDLQICILHNPKNDKWCLPKGRKDRGECLEATAVRETFEETGYRCELLPCRMPTRAPAPDSRQRGAEVVDGAIEPFAVSMRPLSRSSTKGVKFISWYITKLKENSEEKIAGTQTPWENYESIFMDVDIAVERLDFRDDANIARKAVELVREAIEARVLEL